MLLTSTFHELHHQLPQFDTESEEILFSALRKIGASGCLLVYGTCGIAENEEDKHPFVWSTLSVYIELPDNWATHNFIENRIEVQFLGLNVRFYRLEYKTLESLGYTDSNKWRVIRKGS